MVEARKIAPIDESAAANVAALWRPATLLPSQLAHSNWRQHCPEMQLVAAILEDALLSITRRAGSRNSRGRREFIEAWHWLWNERRDWPFTFRNVCDLLALDARSIRNQVQRMVVRRGAAPAQRRT